MRTSNWNGQLNNHKFLGWCDVVHFFVKGTDLWSLLEDGLKHGTVTVEQLIHGVACSGDLEGWGDGVTAIMFSADIQHTCDTDGSREAKKRPFQTCLNSLLKQQWPSAALAGFGRQERCWLFWDTCADWWVVLCVALSKYIKMECTSSNTSRNRAHINLTRPASELGRLVFVSILLPHTFLSYKHLCALSCCNFSLLVYISLCCSLMMFDVGLPPVALDSF